MFISLSLPSKILITRKLLGTLNFTRPPLKMEVLFQMDFYIDADIPLMLGFIPGTAYKWKP